MANSFLKIAKLKTKYLVNCHNYTKLSAKKFLRILSSLQKCLFGISATKLQKLEIVNLDEILSNLHFFLIFTKLKKYF